MKFFIMMILIICISFTACVNKTVSVDSGTNDTDSNNTDKDNSGIILWQYDYAARFAETAPVIDGIGSDSAWDNADWKPIDQVWLGGGNASKSNLNPPPEGTYSGRFKIVWTEDRLCYLV